MWKSHCELLRPGAPLSKELVDLSVLRCCSDPPRKRQNDAILHNECQQQFALHFLVRNFQTDNFFTSSFFSLDIFKAFYENLAARCQVSLFCSAQSFVWRKNCSSPLVSSKLPVHDPFYQRKQCKLLAPCLWSAFPLCFALSEYGICIAYNSPCLVWGVAWGNCVTVFPETENFLSCSVNSMSYSDSICKSDHLCQNQLFLGC